DCNEKFKCKSNLIGHKNRVHFIKEFICEVNECHKVFKAKCYLNAHKRIVHSNNTKYLHCFWPKCEFKTYTKSMLKRHQFIHSEIKQFKCNFNNCNKSYKLKGDLQKHMNSNHLNQYECHKSFSEKSNLFRHKSCVHLNEKKFKCNEENCGKSFLSIHYLIQHQSRHSSDKPFVCDINNCNKSYKRKCYLTEHMKTHKF
ncbi:unnamed protein product, partial [Medioppia subpectinata]